MKPKRLREVPNLYTAVGPGTPLTVTVDMPGAGQASNMRTGGQGSLVTAQHATERDLADLLIGQVTDPEVVSMARRIAERLTLRLRPPSVRPRIGSERTVTARYRYRSDDIDIDRTLELLTERRALEDSEILVRERVALPRATVLVVDVSGSVRGEKVRIAAATVAALAAGLRGPADQLAVVAFWSDAAVVHGFGTPARPAVLLDTLLRMPAHGLTNVHFELAVAAAELARSTARRRDVILLSDAVHNAGPDPRTLASGFPALHVLLETDGEHDEPLGRDLARLGHGRFARVPTYLDVAPALNAIAGA